jgi:hypothetical protein
VVMSGNALDSSVSQSAPKSVAEVAVLDIELSVVCAACVLRVLARVSGVFRAARAGLSGYTLGLFGGCVGVGRGGGGRGGGGKRGAG